MRRLTGRRTVGRCSASPLGGRDGGEMGEGWGRAKDVLVSPCSEWERRLFGGNVCRTLHAVEHGMIALLPLFV